MVKIVVNYEKFEKVAKSIESYSASQKQKMKAATTQVNMLGQSWKGEDYVAFSNAWNTTAMKDSATKAFEESLESYAKVLKATANEYKSAQEKALELANKI